jgi:dihydropteroate synthase
MKNERKRFPWIFRGVETPLGGHTRISAVLDVSSGAVPGKPDSDLLLAQAEALEGLGADFIDVTALPVRPSGKRITPDEELQRLIPTLRRLKSALATPIFVTTYNHETAARVLELEIAGIFDPSGLTVDALMARTMGNTDAALMIGNGPSGPETWTKPRHVPHVVEATTADMQSALRRALSGGVDRRRILLCPGPGLGKRPDQSLELLERLSEFGGLGQATMVSLAHDAFLTETIKASDEAWRAGAAATAMIAVRHGVHVIRTTCFESVKAAVYLADRMLKLKEIAEQEAESAKES